jgi:hypothetical protein
MGKGECARVTERVTGVWLGRELSRAERQRLGECDNPDAETDDRSFIGRQ